MIKKFIFGFGMIKSVIEGLKGFGENNGDLRGLRVIKWVWVLRIKKDYIERGTK